MNEDHETASTLSASIEAATRETSSSLSGLPLHQALAEGTLPLTGYIALVRGLTVAQAMLEHELQACDHPAVRGTWTPILGRYPRLALDSAWAGDHAIGEVPGAVRAALLLADAFQVHRAEHPHALVGDLYVLARFARDCAAFRDPIRRTLPVGRAGGVAWLDATEDPVAGWDALRTRLDGTPLDPAATEDAITGANETLGLLAGLVRACHPAEPQPGLASASSVNPEAGNHAVPDDARVLDAAIRAGELAWFRYGYYRCRYGERGRRFTASDSAWLATLCDCNPKVIAGQIRWMERFLGARGMPRRLLEEHLRILHMELSVAVPERRSAWDRLAPEIERLRAERRAVLPDVRSRALAREFDATVSADLADAHPWAGEILAATVADAACGVPGVADSVAAWLADPARFPEPWCRAVRTFLAAGTGD